MQDKDEKIIHINKLAATIKTSYSIKIVIIKTNAERRPYLN